MLPSKIRFTFHSHEYQKKKVTMHRVIDHVVYPGQDAKQELVY